MINPNKPPQNLEAEASVLGAILIDSNRLYKAEEYLSPEDFYLKKNRIIFENLIALRDNQEAIDVLTLSERLKRQQIFDEIGGVTYLTDLVSEIPLLSNYEGYCRIVRDTALLRRLVNTAMDILNDCYGEYEQVSDLIEAAERKIFHVGQEQISGDFSKASEIISETLQNIRDRVENKGKLTGISSGFNMLDYYTSGLQRSDLIYVAARPSMGKTAFALNIAGHAALKCNATVAIFSLEMSKSQLMQRLICAEACVDLSKIRKGSLNSQEWSDISNASARLYNSKIFIDDTGAANLSDIRSKTRRLKAEHGLDMILIDYLQLMSSKRRSENRQVEISEISRGLKALARELDCPVICLSQLSRAPDSRPDHHPVLADLRESGSIEQDADIVLFLYREHYYSPDDESNVNQAELLVAKQRNGPTGKIDLAWRPEWTKFTNAAGKTYE